MSRALTALLGGILACGLAGPVVAQSPAAPPSSAPEGPDEPGRAEELALGRLARQALEGLAPSIVEIEALGGLEEEFRAPGSEEEAKEQGGILTKGGFKQAYGPTTGLVVREDGLILTTRFALTRDPRHLIATLADGRSFVARALGSDEARGLVLLKVEAKDLPVPTFAGAAELQVGRWALAMGRGLGRAGAGAELPSLSRGIVSGLGRVGGRALQTSAAVSPANYGGPLVGIDGHVLGLLVPLALDGGMASVDIYDSGIGFAIPAPDLLRLVPRLAKGEHLQPGFLGIEPDRSSRDGVRVKQVVPGSPAAAAGLAPGDVVLDVDGVETRFAWQLKRALGARCAGETLHLNVRRGTATRSVEVQLGAQPAAAPASQEEEEDQ